MSVSGNLRSGSWSAGKSPLNGSRTPASRWHPKWKCDSWPTPPAGLGGPNVVSIVDVRNVVKNVANPFTAIRYDGDHGWATFLSTEVFPLSYGRNTARWVPNYSLHLLGGGETYAWMREWFLAREAPAPG